MNKKNRLFQIATEVDEEFMKMVNRLCQEDERNKAQLVRWLIRQEYTRRYQIDQEQDEPLTVAVQ